MPACTCNRKREKDEQALDKLKARWKETWGWLEERKQKKKKKLRIKTYRDGFRR